jgi:hypothetical protein
MNKETITHLRNRVGAAGTVAILLATGVSCGGETPKASLSSPTPTAKASEVSGTPGAKGSATPTPEVSPSAGGKGQTPETPNITLPGCPIPENPKLGGVIGIAVRVPSNLSDVKVTAPNNMPNKDYVNLIYDQFQADQAHDWRGIGPHYPVAFSNIDSNAAILETHGNPGEAIIRANQGGRVAVSFYQEQAHQKDGAWGHDASGNVVLNKDWNMQYTLHGLQANQDIWVVDPDTGRQMLWPDGTTPVVYKANEFGTASFQVPCANGDVRFQLVLQMFNTPGIQAQEIKIERGPNDHPELKGENPLPGGVVKPAVAGD